MPSAIGTILPTVANGPPADGVVKKEPTEKNLVETHEGGLGQDGSENKQKVEEAYGDGAKILD